MVIAIIAGALFGIAGFMPLYFGQKGARKATPTSNLGYAGALLLGVIGSFTVLAASSIGCAVLFRNMVVPFVVAEIAALVVSATAYGVIKLVRR